MVWRMSIIKVECLIDVLGLNGKIIEVEYNALTGNFNGSNKDNWRKILKLSGLPRTASFKDDKYSEVYKILWFGRFHPKTTSR